MAEFSHIIQTLRNQERELEAQLSKVRAAREALETVDGSSTATPEAQPRTGRRAGRQASASTTERRKPRKRFSAATRAKMAAAQKARWAKVKKSQD
jgi:hypothetical protein